MTLAAVIKGMQERSAGFGPEDPGRFFHETYLRTTMAVANALNDQAFVDPEWVEVWDTAFAQLYLDALDQWRSGQTPPGPWAVAFRDTSQPRLPPLRMVLLGMNAHINYDLPQALLAVITDDEFDDPELLRRRAADHARIDDILTERVAAEDEELKRVERPGDRTRVDRMLTPFNRLGTKRFLKEARAKVWTNTQLMAAARRHGTYPDRLRQLGELSCQRVEDLIEPRYVILELAIRGFGVRLL